MPRKKKKSHKKDTITLNVWHLSSAVLLILLIISITTSGFRGGSSSSYALSDQEAGDKVINFINTNVEQVTASITSVARENGLYKITLLINGQQGESYLSADGKILLPQALNLDDPIAVPPPPTQPTQQPTVITAFWT